MGCHQSKTSNEAQAIDVDNTIGAPILLGKENVINGKIAVNGKTASTGSPKRHAHLSANIEEVRLVSSVSGTQPWADAVNPQRKAKRKATPWAPFVNVDLEDEDEDEGEVTSADPAVIARQVKVSTDVEEIGGAADGEKQDDGKQSGVARNMKRKATPWTKAPVVADEDEDEDEDVDDTDGVNNETTCIDADEPDRRLRIVEDAEVILSAEFTDDEVHMEGASHAAVQRVAKRKATPWVVTGGAEFSLEDDEDHVTHAFPELDVEETGVGQQRSSIFFFGVCCTPVPPAAGREEGA